MQYEFHFVMHFQAHLVIPEIKQQIVFSTEEFPNRLLKKSKDLFGQVVDLLEDQFE